MQTTAIPGTPPGFRSFRTSPAALARAAAPARLVSVIRVSRRGGRGGDSFMSPIEQRERIDGYIRANKVELVEEFDETDSVSGGTTDRVGLKGAVAMILAGEADGLIVAKLNRFVRNTQLGLETIDVLNGAGKRLIAVEERIDTSDRDMIKTLQTTFMLGLGQFQREALKQGWINTRERCVMNGVPISVPFGYVKGPERKLVPDTTTVAGRQVADWVVHVFERRAAGSSWSALADELTEMGVPTPTRLVHDRWVEAGSLGKERPRGGDYWLRAQLRNMVDCRTYLGELRSGHEDPTDLDHAWFFNPTAHDPIISMDLWDRAHRTQKTAARRDAVPYLLAGMVRCGSCGGRLRGQTKKVVRETKAGTQTHWYRYYRCGEKYGWGRCPSPAAVRADVLEPFVLDLFEERYVNERTARAAHAPDTGLAAAQEALRSAEAALRGFLTLPSTAELRQLGDEMVVAAQAPLIAAVLDAKARLREQMHGDLVRVLPEDLAATWPDLRAGIEDNVETHEQVRHLLSMLWPVVAVWPGAPRVPVDDRVYAFQPSQVPDSLPSKGEGLACLTPIERPIA